MSVAQNPPPDSRGMTEDRSGPTGYLSPWYLTRTCSLHQRENSRESHTAFLPTSGIYLHPLRGSNSSCSLLSLTTLLHTRKLQLFYGAHLWHAGGIQTPAVFSVSASNPLGQTTTNSQQKHNSKQSRAGLIAPTKASPPTPALPFVWSTDKSLGSPPTFAASRNERTVLLSQWLVLSSSVASQFPFRDSLLGHHKTFLSRLSRGAIATTLFLNITVQWAWIRGEM